MTTTSKNQVWTAGENQYCKDTFRYHTLLYVTVDKKEYYANASCTNFDTALNLPFEYTVEFLEYQGMTIINYPYDPQLFKQIEDAACVQFREMKMEEKVSGAV